jgi:hypothetical protein
MEKQDLVKMLKEKIELKERTARIYDQICGQVALLEDLVRTEDKPKEEKKD